MEIEVRVEKAKELDFSSIPYFSPEEFSDPEYPDSWEFMDATSIVMLSWLRRETGWPIITHNKFGLRGCVCVDSIGHSGASRHYIENGASACDFHFKTSADTREQTYWVRKSGFKGIGIYQSEWLWPREGVLKIAFHVDRRDRFQVWTRKDAEYFYLLD